MARPLRIEYEGAFYHVMSRGNRRASIFGNDGDRLGFLELLARACAKTGWRVHAYCLMSNHFHLVLETPQPNLVAGMKWLLGVYTQRYNSRHGMSGHLFGGRYKAVPIDESTPDYLRAACDYVHLNPARANLAGKGRPLESYVWSSYPEYLKKPKQRVEWVRTDRLLGEHGISVDDGAARRHFRRRMESMREEGLTEEMLKGLREGWRFGAEDFLKRLMKRAKMNPGEGHGRREREETCEARAERIVREEMRGRKWKESDLAKMQKGDAGKVAVARRLREETTVSLRWIAARLSMGGWKNVANKISAENSRSASTKRKD